MADVLTVTGLTETMQRFQTAPSRIPQTVAGIFRTRLAEAVVYARGRYLTGGTTSDRLATRTGALAASFDSTVSLQGQIVYGRLGYLRNPPPWVSVHEGRPGQAFTTIRPRTAHYLAIPLTEAARRAGSPRHFAEDLFAQRSKRGNLLLFRRIGQHIEPVYLLRTQVVIPARPVTRPTVERFAPLIRDDLDNAIQRLLLGRL